MHLSHYFIQNCNMSASTDVYYETDVFLSSWQGVAGYFNTCSNGMVVVADENVNVMTVSVMTVSVMSH